MEQTFYDDSQFRSKEEIKMLKRTMTLDLDENMRASQVNKKQKFTTMLTSPDLHMLKLASPELERLIIAQNGLVTTTPTPTQFLFPKNVTEEQEQYAQGFVQALVQLHQSTGPGGQNGGSNDEIIIPDMQVNGVNGLYSLLQGPPSSLPQSTSSMSNSVVSSHNGTTITTMNSMNSVPPSYSNSVPTILNSISSTSSYVPNSSSFLNSIPHIKEEPQCVPSMGVTPPMSPINMENQEKIKLERKRLRNRIAASKCRRRKLERIARLEDKVRLLKGENNELSTVATRLRDQVCQLKQQVMDHVKSGCQIMISHPF